MPPPPPPDGTQINTNCPISNDAFRSQSGHAGYMPCLQCELPNLLLESMPPDPELVDLIEKAFLDGQIDSQVAELAYLCLLPVLATKAGIYAGTKGN